MPDRAQITPDELLAHAGFVRSLARGLLSDEALVDDVVQETWLRALTNGPRQKEALVSWLRTVTRNLSFKALRGRSRRAAREGAVAREERLPATLDLVARQDSLQGVVDAVRELPEKYREAILMRYFENLPPREIAVRLELPVSTVRMRLHRGLKQLRGHLDREHGGDRGAWMGSLAALTGLRLPELEVAEAGGLSLTTVAATLAGVLTVLCGALWLRADDRLPDGAGLAPPAVPGDLSTADATPPADGPGVRDAVDPGPAALLHGEAADPERDWTLEGVVLDADGRPVEGATLLLDMGKLPAHPRGVSGPDGRYAVTLTEELRCEWLENPIDLLLAARHPDHAPSVLERVTLDEPGVLRLRGPGITWTGRVLDPRGNPVEGALVRVGERARLGFGHLTAIVDRDVGRVDRSRLWPSKSLDRVGSRRLQGYTLARGYMGQGVLTAGGRMATLPPAQEVRTGADGAFRLEGLGPGVQRVQVDARGSMPLEFELDLGPGPCLRDVHLRRGHLVHGQVHRVDGGPLERAHVHALGLGGQGVFSTPVNARGAYHLAGLPPGEYELFADSFEDGRPRHSDSRRVTLGDVRHLAWDPQLAPGPTLRGTLRDGEGEPLEGWSLALHLEDRPPLPADTALTDGRGTFRLDAVPPAAWKLLGRPAVRGPSLPVVLARGFGAPDGPLDLTVEDAADMARVRGRLEDPQGRLLEHFQPLLLVHPEGEGTASIYEGPDGEFESNPLPAGRYLLFVPDGALGVFLDEPLELRGEDVDLGTLELPPTGTLTLPRPPGAREVERVRILRSLPGGTGSVTLFAGRAALPVDVPAQADDYRVVYPDLPGGALTLDLRAR